MQIRQMLVDSSKYSIKCPNKTTLTRVVVHNTANDASAQNEVKYMISNSNEVSFHIAVDDVEAVQGIPFDRNTWNAGDGHGDGNMHGLSIEICYSKSGGDRFTKAEQNAAKLIAQLLKERGWGIDKVTKHQDYNGKYCPHRTLDLGWDRFLNMIKAEMGEEAEVSTPTANKIDEDGLWGKNTTRRAQEVFGTEVDDIVSNQAAAYKTQNPSLLNETFEWQSRPSGYSPLIKAIQKWCGAAQDGRIGPNTIKAMQRKLGTPVDGRCDYPSMMVKAFQKYLNSK